MIVRRKRNDIVEQRGERLDRAKYAIVNVIRGLTVQNSSEDEIVAIETLATEMARIFTKPTAGGVQ